MKRARILLLGGFETVSRFLGRDRVATDSSYYAIRLEERVVLAILSFGLLGVTFAAMILFHTQLQAVHGGTV